MVGEVEQRRWLFPSGVTSTTATARSPRSQQPFRLGHLLNSLLLKGTSSSVTNHCWGSKGNHQKCKHHRLLHNHHNSLALRCKGTCTHKISISRLLQEIKGNQIILIAATMFAQEEQQRLNQNAHSCNAKHDILEWSWSYKRLLDYCFFYYSIPSAKLEVQNTPWVVRVRLHFQITFRRSLFCGHTHDR